MFPLIKVKLSSPNKSASIWKTRDSDEQWEFFKKTLMVPTFQQSARMPPSKGIPENKEKSNTKIKVMFNQIKVMFNQIKPDFYH